jgi:replicative DNA helicase
MEMSPLALKIPPHSVEAEQAVLGGLLLDNQAWDTVADRLRAELFYTKDHQLIFKAMMALAAISRPIDVITVSEHLEGTQQLNTVGGLAYLGNLAKNTPSAANIVAYADIVSERATLRELITIGAEISEAACNPDGRASHEILDLAERKVFDIAEKGNRHVGPEAIKHIVARAIDKIEQRFQDGSQITGLATGFSDFDRMTSGLQPGDLVIVAGRPSMGKTTFAMNMAEHASIRGQKTVLVFSMEMPADSLAIRMLSSLGRIDQHHLRTGKLMEDDWARLTNAVGWLGKAKMVIDETGALSPMDLRSRARRVARDYSDLGLIVIDYLQLMHVSGRSENRTAEISEISRSLKALAKELRVPIIALSQLNRSLEQRPNKRPVMSDLRESGAIEQDADLIAFIYRDEVYHEDSDSKGVAEIIIAKQRNGPIGTLRLTFSGKYTRFDNFVGQEAFVVGG